MKKCFWVCLCLTVGFTIQLFAAERNGTLRGYVKDSQTGETLPNATVLVDSTKLGMSADRSGYFVISHLAPGPYTITVSYIGYLTKSLKVDVQSERTTTCQVELAPTTLQGTEIVAQGKRVPPTDVTTVGSFATRVTELARIPTVGQPDLLRSIQLLPGVQASSDNSSGLYVQGGTPGQNLILLDGVVVYNPSHLFGFFSTFNPDALKNVLLLKGAFPARYGDRLSSVLDVTNLDGNRNAFSLKTSVDMISAGATAQGPLGDNGSFMVSGRRTYQELLHSPLFDHIVNNLFSTRTGTFTAAPGTVGSSGFGGRFGGGFGGFGNRFGRGQFTFGRATSNFAQNYDFYDTNFKINTEPSESDKISLSGYFGHDGLNLTLPSFGSSQRQQAMGWGNQVGSLRWMHMYGDKLAQHVQMSVSRYNSDFQVASSENGSQTFGPGGGGFGLDRYNTLLDLTAKVDLAYYESVNNTTRIGGQITRYDAVYRQGFSDSVRSSINSISLYETGYIEHTWRSGGLELIPGVRFSHFQSGNYTGISPRVSGSYRLNDRVTFKAGWGIYRQYINLISVEGFSYTTDMWLPVDRTLAPGRAEHIAGGVDLTPADGWDLDLEFYHKALQNLVEFQSQVRIDANTPLSDLFLQGTGRSYGGELLLRKTVGRTTGWLGYTLARTFETIPQLNQGKEFPPKYDRRHDISIVLDHNFGRGWNVNLNWVYGTGQAYTVPESQYTIVQPSGQTISYVHVSGKNAYRLPAYHRMDIGLTKDFHVGEVGGQFIVSVFNVYDRRNVWYRTFNISGGQVQVQDVLLQPILPSVGIKFDF